MPIFYYLITNNTKTIHLNMSINICKVLIDINILTCLRNNLCRHYLNNEL